MRRMWLYLNSQLKYSLRLKKMQRYTSANINVLDSLSIAYITILFNRQTFARTSIKYIILWKVCPLKHFSLNTSSSDVSPPSHFDCNNHITFIANKIHSWQRNISPFKTPIFLWVLISTHLSTCGTYRTLNLPCQIKKTWHRRKCQFIDYFNPSSQFKSP